MWHDRWHCTYPRRTLPYNIPYNRFYRALLLLLEHQGKATWINLNRRIYHASDVRTHMKVSCDVGVVRIRVRATVRAGLNDSQSHNPNHAHIMRHIHRGSHLLRSGSVYCEFKLIWQHDSYVRCRRCGKSLCIVNWDSPAQGPSCFERYHTKQLYTIANARSLHQHLEHIIVTRNLYSIFQFPF